MCGYLNGGSSLAAAWSAALNDRKSNLPDSWNDSRLRQAENYLYANAAIAEYGDNAILVGGGVILHQSAKLIVPNTSPVSLDALRAGLEGVVDGAMGKTPNCGCKGQ